MVSSNVRTIVPIEINEPCSPKHYSQSQGLCSQGLQYPLIKEYLLLKSYLGPYYKVKKIP